MFIIITDYGKSSKSLFLHFSQLHLLFKFFFLWFSSGENKPSSSLSTASDINEIASTGIYYSVFNFTDDVLDVLFALDTRARATRPWKISIL